MNQWTAFHAHGPEIGQFILAIGKNKNNNPETGEHWLFWGTYNPEKEQGRPPEGEMFWIAIPPFPDLKDVKEEPLNDQISDADITYLSAEELPPQTTKKKKAKLRTKWGNRLLCRKED